MALKPWENLKDKFGALFSRDLSKEAPNPASLSGAGIGRADAVGSSEYLEGGSTFNHAVEISDLNDFLEVGEHTDRRARYLEYDRLENIPEVSSSLDTYSDEVTVPDMDGRIFTISTPNREVKKELEWLFYDLLQIDTEDLWSWSRNVCKNGDLFLELIIDSDNPHLGIQKISELPPETIYRIETVKGKLLEFQQSYTGPDYQAAILDIQNKDSVARSAVSAPTFSPVTTTGTTSTYGSMSGSNKISNVIRFSPEQIVHMRIGTKRRGFYPYGVSILYAARRVAHLLKLMEDAMVIYRLVRAPERRVFYIDIGTLPPHKGEGVLERIRDKIKKKKVFNRKTGQIDERYNPWAADEDFFIPTRPESNSRIETLPGGSSLGEIDDTKYFREKLMVALKLPKNYLFQDDIMATRTSFATQDMRFARAVYRIQKIIAQGIKRAAERHLVLRGFAQEDIVNLNIKFTAPSDWMELSRSELLSNRYNLAASIKSSNLYDDFTILTKILNHTKEEAKDIIDRKEQQLLRDQELNAQAQIYAQLNTPDLSAPQDQPSPPYEPEQDFSQDPSMQQGTGFEELPTITSPEEEPIKIPKDEKEKISNKIRKQDYSDLEADEEEVDLNYEEE